MAYDPMDTTGRRQRRGCCYCCCGTKKRVSCCLTTLLLTIVAIVLVLYFFIPRKPTFCFTVGYPEDFTATTSGISVTLPVNVSVDNPNYFGFSLVDAKVFLNYNERQPVTNTAIGTVNLAAADAPDIHVKRRGNSTVSIFVTFPANSGTTTANTNIVADCTPSGTTHLYVNATVTLLKRIHITVPNQEISVNCSTVGIAGAGGAALVQSATGNSTASYFCKKP